jgi:hypothetical protein
MELEAKIELPIIDRARLVGLLDALPLARQASATVRLAGTFPLLSFAGSVAIAQGAGLGSVTFDGSARRRSRPAAHRTGRVGRDRSTQLRRHPARYPHRRASGSPARRDAGLPSPARRRPERRDHGARCRCSRPSMRCSSSKMIAGRPRRPCTRPGSTSTPDSESMRRSHRLQRHRAARASRGRPEARDLARRRREAGASMGAGGTACSTPKVSGTVGGLRVPLGSSGVLGAERASVQGRVHGALDDLTVEATAQASQLSAQGESWDDVRVSVAGPLDRLRVTADVRDELRGHMKARGDLSIPRGTSRTSGSRSREAASRSRLDRRGRLRRGGLRARGVELTGPELGTIRGGLALRGQELVGELVR